MSDRDRQTRYECWQCGTERWLPERPDDPSWRVRVKCERCNRPMGHHPVGSPHPAQLGEVVLDE
jgi:DNA-directed RNA polymerase subunit RPC12/RpoP